MFMKSVRGTRQQQVRSAREREDFGRPARPKREAKAPPVFVWLVLFVCIVLPVLLISLM